MSLEEETETDLALDPTTYYSEWARIDIVDADGTVVCPEHTERFTFDKTLCKCPLGVVYNA